MKLFSYSYDILLHVNLIKLDRKKVLDADFEIARAFKKHFLMSGNYQIPIFCFLIFLELKKPNHGNSNEYERPTTAPAGPRPHTAHGTRANLGIRGSRKFVGRFEQMKEIGKSRQNGVSELKGSLEKETLSAIKETNYSDFTDPDARYEVLLNEFEDIRREKNELKTFLNEEKMKVEKLDGENKRLKLELKVLES